MGFFQDKEDKEEKKEFGKDKREISMSSSKAEKDKSEFAKLGEKLTSYTENKDLENF